MFKTFNEIEEIHNNIAKDLREYGYGQKTVDWDTYGSAAGTIPSMIFVQITNAPLSALQLDEVMNKHNAYCMFVRNPGYMFVTFKA